MHTGFFIYVFPQELRDHAKLHITLNDLHYFCEPSYARSWDHQEYEKQGSLDCTGDGLSSQATSIYDDQDLYS